MWQKKNIISKNIFLSILFIALLNFQSCSYLWNLTECNNNLFDKRILLVAQGSGDDTTSPVINFIQPLRNNTIITESTYDIIVNISDDNPPLYGNVTLRISNQTNLVFSATMDYKSEYLWSYRWNNISTYSNLEWYLIQVWAKDSSSNENLGKSDEFYIYLYFSKTPDILSMVLSLIAVEIIIVGIFVYINKKILPKISKKKGERTNGLLDD